jgi:hypothetical protein
MRHGWVCLHCGFIASSRSGEHTAVLSVIIIIGAFLLLQVVLLPYLLQAG